MTSFESEHLGSSHLLNSCMFDFKLCTRKPVGQGYQFTHYNLIEQTKSIAYYQSDYFGDLSFDPTCSSGGSSGSQSNGGGYFYKYANNPRSLTGSNHDDDEDGKCYVVTKVDALTSLKVDEYLDCECNSTKSVCSFSQWSNFNKKSNETESRSGEDPLLTCAQSSAFACFNNATCVDTSLSPTQPYTCQCVGSYTGDR